MDRKLSLLIQFAAVDQLSGSLRSIIGLGKTGGQQMAALKKEASVLKKELGGVRKELSASAGSTADLTPLISRERELAASVARANTAIERQGRLLKIQGDAARISQRGQELRSSGTENVVTGVAMAAPMILATRQAMTLESAMADVRKVVDFETPQQFRQMSDDLLDLSTKIPMSAEGLATIVAAAGRASIPRKELLAFAQDAARMGIAFDTTAEDAGGMMAKWRTAFGMGQSEVVALSDQINALTNRFGGNALAVSGITTRIGALGKVAGVAAPEIAAMGQLMNSVGVEEEIAATGVKNMMLAMTKGTAATKSQKAAFASLGLDAQTLAKRMQEDAGGAITDLLQRVQRLPKEAQAGTLTELFGSESVAAIAPLLANLDRLAQNFAFVGDKAKYAGSMEKEYLARIATTEGATGLALNALKAVNITLGNMLLPTVTAASQKIVVIANAVREWASANPGLAKGLSVAWVALTGFVLGMGALKIAFGLVLGPFSTVFRLVATNGPMIARTFGIMRTAAIYLGKGFMRAGMMMLANPMVLIITAIVVAIGLAAYLIYTHWDTIKAAFATAVTALGQAWTAIKAGFDKGVAALGQAWAWIKEKFNAGLAFLTALPGQMVSVGAQIIAGLVRGIMAAPGAVWNALKWVVMGGIANVKELLGLGSPSSGVIGLGGDRAPRTGIAGKRALGGPVSGGRTYLVGERGPELFQSSSGGRIVSNKDLRGSNDNAHSAGGDTYHFHIKQLPGEDSEMLARRVAELIERKRGNHRRGGYSD